MIIVIQIRKGGCHYNDREYGHQENIIQEEGWIFLNSILGATRRPTLPLRIVLLCEWRGGIPSHL